MKKLSIEDAKRIAISKNGNCISSKYIDSKHKLVWQCANGHVWQAPLNKIKSHWCPVCCKKKPSKYSIDDVCKFAAQKGGLCLTQQYHKTIDLIQWRCSEGHVWNATFSEVKKGTWCPTCANESLRIYTVEECKRWAQQYYGDCLSKTYTNTKIPMRWRCELKHKWKATWGNIKDNGSWCPVCSQSYGEQKFREILEGIMKAKFPKRRPMWLKNQRGNRMEIDGYNDELKMGFEYQGRQHFEYIPHWHKRKDQYQQQRLADQLKKSQLEERGVWMLYPTHSLKPSEFEGYIREACEPVP